MVVPDVPVGSFMTGPLSEERVVPVHSRPGSSQVPSLAELRLCVKQLIKEPPGLREGRLYYRMRCAEEIKKDEMFDCRELSRRRIVEQATF